MREEEEKKRTNDVFFLLAMRRYTLLPTRLLVLHDGAGDGCYAIWVDGRWGIRMGVVWCCVGVGCRVVEVLWAGTCRRGLFLGILATPCAWEVVGRSSSSGR